MMTTDLPEAPAYFPRDAEINRTGAAALAELPRPAALAPEAVHACAQREVVVLDVRPAAAFGAGHVPGAMNIGLGGQFASWAGRLLALETPLVIVAEDEAQVEEAVTRLARVGMEHVQGYLDGGMYAWHQAGLPVTTIAQIPVDELRHQLEEGQDVQVVDVRQPGEYTSGHVPGAISLPLAHLAEGVAQLHPERSVVVICAGGYRSSAGTGILARLGFTHLCNVVGGTSAWVNAGYAVEPVRATTS
jgi:hydroxyacylglutathione hydrolase